MAFVTCDDTHTAGPLHERRTDEDPGEGLAVHAFDVQRQLEAVHLTAVTVATYVDVEQTETCLARHAVGDVAGEHDHAGAGRKRREAFATGLAQRLEQADTLHEHRHGRALATWEDDAVETFEIFARPHEPRACARLFQCFDVFRERSLHREDPDEGFGVCFPTSLGQRAARPSGWPGSRGRASLRPAPPKPRPAPLVCRSR